MLVVRPVQIDDLDSLFALISQSELGLTTLKISREKLLARIEDSLYAFSRSVSKPDGRPYVFVMEDAADGKLVGTSAIYSKVGGFEPFYSYQLKTSVHESAELGVRKEVKALHLVADHDGPTEIGSLFLAPEYWGQGHGRLLSLARFLFVAQFPERFENEIIAELRGVVGKDGRSPLWASLGSHFFQIAFPKAETLTSESKKFIADLMPQHPIYIPLLPQEAQDAIGQVHRNTRPARTMLESEGFEYRGFVDIFDGGPTLHAAVDDIRVVAENSVAQIVDIAKELPNGVVKIISNCENDFRACVSAVAVNSNNGGEISIDQQTATSLQLDVGDQIRFVDSKAKT